MGVYGHHISHISEKLNKRHYFSNHLLTVDAYYKLPRLYGMENITTEEVMRKLDMFKEIFGKVDEFGRWDMERVQTDSVTHFTSKEFQEGLSVHSERLVLASLDHQ